MKVYSIIITLVAVLAIGAAGYFYWQYSGANKQVLAVKQEKDGVQKDLDQTKQELTNVKMSFDGIKPFSAALKSVVDSFVVAGDTKVSTIGSVEATTARQKIGDITDNTDKTSAEKNWDDFHTSLRVSDLQSLIRTLSFGIERNIQNATNHPAN